NFAEAIAEGKGKAQAESLKKSKKDIIAHLLIDNNQIKDISATELKKGNIVVCTAGDMIPLDGEIIEGIASVNESAITGESAPVIRESGGDRSAVTGGTQVLSDRIVIKVTVNQGESFIDRLIALVEGASRKKTPNEIALSILLVSLTILFILAVVTLKGFIIYSEKESVTIGLSNSTIPILIALIVCLIPTTIGGLLSAIGISGMDRLIRKNVIAMSGKAVEAAGDVDVLLIDKTGTITYGNRQASEFIANNDTKASELARFAQSASLADTTPEGESIMDLAEGKYGLPKISQTPNMTFIPFSAQTAMSGVDIIEDNKTIMVRKGSVNAIVQFVTKKGGVFPPKVRSTADIIARSGATPLVVAKDEQVLGIIVLKDIVKEGIAKRFAELRKMGIKTIMITGDNPLTAATIAAEAGVDDYISEAKPEDKLQRIILEQEQGHLIAMVGDGTNDAPALAQADVAVAMNTGTQAAREAGNMIDLDSSPTKLIEIVEVGKQLLMTRGSLTTFSIANDISKYFAILPALFIGLYADKLGHSPLAILNIMHLASPMSAILSAVIFNALIIVALIPLALKGVKYRPIGAKALMVRNMTVYGFGGIIAPFIGIKLIDIFINAVHLV
ncbi:MAG: potassium-transporting ATPase subunit KdpB, partial [Nitrospirae bacterium]|nr:potassium-transporting ATPase subunit KdpB [Nitrospirota bacterium]